jgi:hypothetical protein
MTTPAVPAAPLEVFLSYAREDEALSERLVKHLSVLKRQRVIRDRDKRQISAGTDWAGQLSEHLYTARIILVLVSPDFMGSDYHNAELKIALERHDAGTARVIPVILRPTDWEGTPLGKLQAVPKDAKPVILWEYQDQAFLDIVHSIRRVVLELTANP